MFVVLVLMVLLGLALLVGESWILWQIMRQQGRMLLRLESLEEKPIAVISDKATAVSDKATPVSEEVQAAQPSDTPTWAFSLAAEPDEPEEHEIELTIGMATYNDFDGVYFTLQSLRLYHDLEHTELLVVDNYGCDHTKNLVENWLHARYIRATNVKGTAAPRDLVFRHARGKAVLCCDSHILFVPGVIAQLKQFYREHPHNQDLLQGPMLYDNGQNIATHFAPQWREQMWGTWATDPRGQDPTGEPFDIPMQGLGVFSCRKNAWLGFHPQFRGFGGEEGYIHEKFRQAGRRSLCLPWLRWLHRFGRPSGVPYPLTIEDKLRNYLLGHSELGLDLVPALEHFAQYLPQEHVLLIAQEALGGAWTDCSLAFDGQTCMYASPQSDVPMVSVVLPVYNGARYLRAAVQSLLQQTLQQIEVIIVNDGSSDRTAQIMHELAADPRVRLVHQPHMGGAQARNRGIALARAQYIAAQDADDVSMPERLAKQYAFLEQHPEVGLVGAMAKVINEAGEIIGAFGGIVTESSQIHAQLLKANCFIHGTVMMRKSAVEAVGKYREILTVTEDYDLWLRMDEHVPLANIGEVLYLYRVHPETTSKKSGILQSIQAGIVLELAHERLQTGSDLLMRGGAAAFMDTYGRRLQPALAPEQHGVQQASVV